MDDIRFVDVILPIPIESSPFIIILFYYLLRVRSKAFLGIKVKKF